MGLNESFAPVRGQILLMDPMPPINKVFSLIRQEERQRSIGSLNASLSNPFVESTTLLCKSEGTKTVGSRQFFQKKERPQCTHCGLLGHTVDKCYKLHGFPLGYKTQGKNPTANKISLTSFGQTAGVVTNEFSNLQLSQVQAQCEQVLALLNNKTLSNPIGHASNSHHQASANTISSNLPSSSMTGIPFYTSSCFSSNFTPNLSHSVFSSHTTSHSNIKHNSWILDTGATNHIVHSISCLSTITSTIRATIELPNGNMVPVTHIGTVKLSSSLILTNVLCVPSFHFNLISVSKLVQSSLCLIFLSNYCFIQAFIPWRMIGLGKILLTPHFATINFTFLHFSA
jgi:hypothetical protein